MTPAQVEETLEALGDLSGRGVNKADWKNILDLQDLFDDKGNLPHEDLTLLIQLKDRYL